MKNSGLQKARRWFLLSTSIALVVTGLAKFGAAFQPLPLLFIPDPILGISYKKVMMCVGSLELVVAGILLVTKNQQLKLCLVAWLGACFLTYRAFYKAMGASGRTSAKHRARRRAEANLFGARRFGFPASAPAWEFCNRLMGIVDPCPCLGTLTAWLHLGRTGSNLFLGLFSIWLVSAGLFFLFWGNPEGGQCASGDAPAMQ